MTRKISSKAELKKLIENTASKYSDEEIFSNYYFYDHLQSLITAMCAKLERIPYINAFCDPNDDTTACTDGEMVKINTLGPLIKDVTTPQGKYVNIFGHITHECGHVLFTDFEVTQKRYEALMEGKTSFYPFKPTLSETQEFCDYLDSHPNYKKTYIQLFKGIDNSIEDVFIENKLYEMFSGLCTVGVNSKNDEAYRKSLSKEELYDAVLSKKIPPFSAFEALLLVKRKLGYIPKNNVELNKEQREVDQEIEHYFELCEAEFDELSICGDGYRRSILLNDLFIKLSPLLPRPENDEDMQPSLSDQIQEMLQQALQTAMQNGGSQAPQGNTAPVQLQGGSGNNVNQAKANENKQKASNQSQSQKALEAALQKAKQEMAKAQCEEADESEHQQQLQEEANSIEDSHHCGDENYYGMSVKRENKPDGNYVQMYNQIFRTVEKTSKNLVRKIANILKERETESSDSGYLFGQKFNSKDVFHNDGKYFSRITVPDGKLKVAFGILVDESGSMGCNKSSNARKTAILLEDALRNLNIPLMVAGHTTGGGKVLINSYVDFDTYDEKDKYRLASITSHANNIDGAAITYVGDKLLKRSEDIKVMIVISDGMPCGVSHYHPSDRKKDVINCVKHYRKKGIKVFGAVVDEYEDVAQLYGKEFTFDCTSSNALEKTLIKLISKYCLLR